MLGRAYLCTDQATARGTQDLPESAPKALCCKWTVVFLPEVMVFFKRKKKQQPDEAISHWLYLLVSEAAVNSAVKWRLTIWLFSLWRYDLERVLVKKNPAVILSALLFALQLFLAMRWNGIYLFWSCFSMFFCASKMHPTVNLRRRLTALWKEMVNCLWKLLVFHCFWWSCSQHHTETEEEHTENNHPLHTDEFCCVRSKVVLSKMNTSVWAVLRWVCA